MSDSNIVIMPIIRREAHTLDFMEQRDNEMRAFVAMCHGNKPHRTRPLLVISKKQHKDRSNDRNANGNRKRSRGNNR